MTKVQKYYHFIGYFCVVMCNLKFPCSCVSNLYSPSSTVICADGHRLAKFFQFLYIHVYLKMIVVLTVTQFYIRKYSVFSIC